MFLDDDDYWSVPDPGFYQPDVRDSDFDYDIMDFNAPVVEDYLLPACVFLDDQAVVEEDDREGQEVEEETMMTIRLKKFSGRKQSYPKRRRISSTDISDY